MNDADRFKLLFGPYTTPNVEVGQVLSCEARDCDVIMVGYSDARIPWPVGQRRGKGARALVVYGRLADAVRHESNQAVAHWWGVTPQTVTKGKQDFRPDLKIKEITSHVMFVYGAVFHPSIHAYRQDAIDAVAEPKHEEWVEKEWQKFQGVTQ